MKTDTETEIDLLNKAVTCLEKEAEAKDELIQAQKATIEMLEEYNAKLKELINNILNF